MLTTLASLVLAPLITATASDDAKFADPIEIMADGNTFSKVIYPSPVSHDLDGDGKSELVIGDLRGFIQYASRTSDSDSSGWGPMTKMKAVDGKDIKFKNW